LTSLVQQSTVAELESLQALFEACLKDKKKCQSLVEILDVLKFTFTNSQVQRHVLFIIRAASPKLWLK
jgi:hypothetical protein